MNNILVMVYNLLKHSENAKSCITVCAKPWTSVRHENTTEIKPKGQRQGPAGLKAQTSVLFHVLSADT